MLAGTVGDFHHAAGGWRARLAALGRGVAAPSRRRSRPAALDHAGRERLAWRTLARMARDERLRAQLSWLDATVEVVGVGGADRALFDYRRDGARAPGTSCCATLTDEIAWDFWTGQTREPLLLLQGLIEVAGDAATGLRFLRALPELGMRFRELSGARTEVAPRFCVLREYGISQPHLTHLPEIIDTRVRRDRAALVGTIVLGLHPLCRRLELDLLARAADAEDADAADVLEVARFIARCAAEGPRNELAQRCATIRST